MTIMTNEERAREAAKEIGKHEHVVEHLWVGERNTLKVDAEAIILAALNAATAELEEERGHLKEALRMTNEERAREAADRVTEEICGFSQRSRDDVEAATRIILTALNAATAELEAERGRLREAPAFVCGAIIAPNGSLRFIDVISDERYAWDYAFGFPDEEEIARCKKEGFRYQLMYAFTCDHRSALPELIARVERAEKERDRLTQEVARLRAGRPTDLEVQAERFRDDVRGLAKDIAALTGDVPNV